jgi:acid ceramidase
LKPKRFSLSLDERFQIDGGLVGILRWLIGDRSGKWAGFLMRDVLEQAGGYDEALSLLMNSKLLAPVYFIVGGNSSSQVLMLPEIRTTLSFNTILTGCSDHTRKK